MKEKNQENKEDYYELLANLRQSGDGNYSSLTSTYLTILTILMGFVAVLLGENGSTTNQLFVYFISMIGIYISFQMIAAQTRYRAQNWILDRYLRGLEKKHKRLPQIHNLKDKLINKHEKIPEKKHLPSIEVPWVLKNLKYFPRMKALPKVIITFFVFAIIVNTLRIFNILN